MLPRQMQPAIEKMRQLFPIITLLSNKSEEGLLKESILSNNGTEFTSTAILRRRQEKGIR